MKPDSTHTFRYLFGGLIGVLVYLLLTFIYQKISASPIDPQNKIDVTQNAPLIKSRPDSMQLFKAVIELKEKNNVLIEQVNGLKERINDFYILGGIIVTLLLAINVSVYLRTESEVEKHMKSNFEEYSKRVKKDAQESEVMLGQIRAQAGIAQQLVQQIRSNLQSNQ